MPETDQLEEAFRAATKHLDAAPVRETRVKRLVRRRRVLAAIGLVSAAVGLTVLIAGALVAGKSAVDPEFDPPFFAGASSEIDFGEPEVVRGHTPLRVYLAMQHQPTDLSSRELALEGLVFRGNLDLVGHRGKQLRATWTLHPVGSDRRVPAPTYSNVSVIRPRHNHEGRRISAWIGPPKQTGRYVVGFTLTNRRGKVLEQSRSKPFVILGTDYFAPYATPAYTARLPANWKLGDDYEQTPDGRFVTTMAGPRGVSVLIDTTPGYTGAPGPSARRLHAGEKGRPGYRLLKLQPARLGPGKVYEWSFELNGRRKTDIFFTRGGDGYAVLAEGPPRRFSLIRSVAREVARSVRPAP